MQPELILNPDQLVTVDDASPTVSVLWDRAAQQAVIETRVGPTVASRAYGLVHTAMFDAWAAYDETAIATQLGDDLQRPKAENTNANKAEAMSFAAYQVLSELFPEQTAIFDDVMVELGFDLVNTSTDTTTPAGIGNFSAEVLMNFRQEDGANQANDYVDTTSYAPVNTPDNIRAIDRWTPERVPINSPDAALQEFLTPQWGMVEAFSFDSPDPLRPEAPQPFLSVDDASTDLEAGTITLADGSVLGISLDLVGSIINPEFIAQAETVIDFSANLNDEQKLIAEFWEDGGGTSFPPGTWMTFGQFVSARDDNSLDEDVQLFFTLGNAVFDAGIATWEAKVFYDYVRPVRAVRSLGELGLIGEFDADLGGFAIEAWAGPEQGTQTILATDFTTYQTPGSDPSPPFAEYTSGHSAFSAAGATVLELLSGSDAFGAGVTFAAGESRFEPGFTPQSEVTLAWETFAGAADEAGLSRLYGGIHFTEGDINGRTLGQEVGASVFETAQFFINGGQEQTFFVGNRTSDEFVGSEFDEAIHGRGGNDLIAGELGDDVIFGGDGEDILRGDQNLRQSGNIAGGDDVIFGGTGNDRIGGKAGNDTLFGEAGNDQIWGDGGSDVLRGGLGDDILTGDDFSGGQGSDTFVLALGEGTDTIVDFVVGEDFIGLADGLTFDKLSLVQEGQNTLVEADQEVLAVLNNVTSDVLSAAADIAFVAIEDEPSSVELEPETEQVLGAATNDVFDAADPRDDFDGDRDTVFAGAGDDLVDASQATSSFMTSVTSTAGRNRIYGGLGADELLAGNHDLLFGGEGNDTLDASFGTGRNFLYGNDGNDELFGGESDLLFGGEGNDILDSSFGSGNNQLEGQGGEDILFAGEGDRLFGDDGDDTFFITDGGENVLTGGVGADTFWIATGELVTSPNTISDFTLNEDLIGLGGSGATSASDLEFRQIGADTVISLFGFELAILQSIQANILETSSAFVFA